MKKKKGREFKKFIQNSLCRYVIVPYVFRKYNYKCGKITGVDGPALIIANHVTNMDPFLVGAATPNHLSFVATENVMRGSVTGWLLNHVVDIIIHRKGKSGLKTIMDIKNNLAMGDSVVLFPEGNRSFNGETGEADIEGLIKMIGRLGGTIVTYRLEGGYFTTPRWALKCRRGQMTGRMMNVYSPDILKKNVTEISEKIRSDIYVNAFEDQAKNRIAYKGRELAAGMESFAFLCPACESYSSLRSEGDNIKCTCGMKLLYNEYGELHNDSEVKVPDNLNLLTWDALQKNSIADRELNAITFAEDRVTISRIEDHRAVDRREGVLKITDGRLTVRIGVEEMTINSDELDGVSIFSRNVLTAYRGDSHYEIRGDVRFNALKYYYLFNKA